MVNLLSRLNRRLLPDNPDIGYTPYFWLLYLIFLLPGLFFTRWGAISVWLTVLSVIVFLPLYFRSFWLEGQAMVYNNLLIALIGVLLLPINISACTYFIYAAAGIGFISNMRSALVVIFGLGALLVLESWLLGFPTLAMLMPAALVLMIGCANLFHGALMRKNHSLRLSQAEVTRLATVAERERISRDLHDLLGHSLSLITLKAELAGKLLQRENIQRAGQEIDDLERISRTALSEVREAVSGYRQADLHDELQHADEALSSADIKLNLSGEYSDLPSAHDNALAMCVREAVTNIIRHSDANNCWIQFSHDRAQVKLSISDDGEPLKQEIAMGSGLKGMQDRLAIMGGDLTIRQNQGLHLQIQLPTSAISNQSHQSNRDKPFIDADDSNQSDDEPYGAGI